MKHYKTQICIVGSGVAGCLCAKYLAKQGADVLIVERGSRITHQERLKSRRHEANTPASEHHEVVKAGLRGHQFQYVYALGGTTNHWAGQTPRLHPNDFQMRSLYGVMDDWPLTYEDLEPYYCLAEEEMTIAGPPDTPMARSRPYPLPAHPLSPMDKLFQKCFPEHSIVAVPQARPTKPVGYRPACCASATCYLCPIDSKYTPVNTHIPELEKFSNVQFLTDTVVLALNSGNQRKVNSVSAVHSNGEEMQIEANVFILAANALENAAIVLRSRDLEQHPLTGTHLFDHSGWSIYAVLSQEGFPFHGNSLFTGHCYYFYDGSFRSQRAGALGEIMNVGLFRIADLVTEKAKLGMRGQELRDSVERQFRNQIGINFMLEDIPNPDRRIRISNKRNSIGVPLTEISYPATSAYVHRTIESIDAEIRKMLAPLQPKSFVKGQLSETAGHLLGTCRMGTMDRGVVDSNLRYHHCDNLFLLGGSAFPTFSPANPTLTIAALSIRLGQFLQTA